MTSTHRTRRAADRLCLAIVAVLFPLAAAVVSAQHVHDHDPEPAREGWTLSGAANVFAGVNHQDRRFRDFTQWESQNWFMGDAALQRGPTRLRLHTMWSLEAWTLADLGSPQLFQTGETFQGAPLKDYQHPHDLIMALGAQVVQQTRGVQLTAEASLVGEPALGPPVFMHRASATSNPQVPLGHHQLDATHVTSSVLTIAATARQWTLAASAFHGREPDENRTDLDLGALDSWSARLLWSSGTWQAQVSGGRLQRPEAVEPDSDVTRLTASVGWSRQQDERPSAVLLAWGLNREIHGDLAAYLAEADTYVTRRARIYGRAELVTKDLLDAGGIHPPGFVHPHRLSRVAAVTLGYSHDLYSGGVGGFAVGGDVTGYRVAHNLRDGYGTRPISAHLFVRWWSD